MPKSSTGRQAIRLDTDHTVQELMASAVVRISAAIRVELCEQQVRLTGSVASWHEKQLAQETLRSISQSYVISNEITVPAWN
jgi:hypothetical protein